MKCRNFVAVTLSCVFVCLAVPQAKADFAITDFGRVQVNNLSSTNRMLGWIFTANTPMEVTQLGVWDNDTDGLLASHRVGIWDAGGTLLGDTTILSGTGSPTAGGVIGGGTWRYEPINISLAAGRYTIGALYNADDDFESDASFVTASPFIAFDEERFSDTGSGFVFPTNTGGRKGLFGPNFQFNIPEPDCSDFPCGNNGNKVQLCHVPPGNPENENTLCISPNAVAAHLENHEGDHCGPCAGDDDGLALLAVESNAPGVLIDVTPVDNNEESGGFAPFERSYELFSLISLTAPKTQQGRTFVRWDFDTAFVVDADGLTLHLLVITGYPQRVTAIYSSPQRNPGPPPGGK